MDFSVNSLHFDPLEDFGNDDNFEALFEVFQEKLKEIKEFIHNFHEKEHYAAQWSSIPWLSRQLNALYRTKRECEAIKPFWVGEIVIKRILAPQIEAYERQARHLRWKRRNKAGDKQLDIAAAKAADWKRFLTLNRAGFALCPFHEEKTPSFKVYKDGSWHCFGCHAHGGDIIDFVRKKYNLSFREAVNKLME